MYALYDLWVSETTLQTLCSPFNMLWTCSAVVTQVGMDSGIPT